MAMLDVNWLAVLLCGVSSLVLGGIWYSPLLFSKAWQRSAGLSGEQLAGGNMALIFGFAFLLSVVSATLFAIVLGRTTPVDLSVVFGAAAGALWVGTSFGINYLFERRGVTHWLINAGYHTLQFALFGLILGLMP